jgi:predicted DNA-binding ribbon-helix-helix protein
MMKKKLGRPFVPDAIRRDYFIHIRLNQYEFDKLHKIAKERKITVSDLIRKTFDL